MEKKRGQSNIFGNILVGLLFAYLVILIVFIVMNLGQGNLYDAVTQAFTESSDIYMKVLGPIFGTLLGAKEDNAFLMILAFIFASVVVVGTLDLVNIFGESGQNGWINFFIGVLIAVIGVRLMPEDMWGSLASPGNALIAIILVGTPFAAVFFVSTKINKAYLRRTLWAVYSIFMIYIMFSKNTNTFRVIYTIFIIAAILMILFDASVTKILYKERKKIMLQKKAEQVNNISRNNLQKELEEAISVYNDAPAASEEKKQARMLMRELQKEYEKIGTEENL